MTGPHYVGTVSGMPDGPSTTGCCTGFGPQNPDLHWPQLGMWNIFTWEYSKREQRILSKMTTTKNSVSTYILTWILHVGICSEQEIEYFWILRQKKEWLGQTSEDSDSIQLWVSIGAIWFLQQMANIYLLHLHLFVSITCYLNDTFFQSKMCFYTFLLFSCFSPLNSQHQHLALTQNLTTSQQNVSVQSVLYLKCKNPRTST